MSNYSYQNTEVKPDDVMMFDVVRLRHGKNNTMGVIMRKMYAPNSDLVSGLLIYKITPVHNPTEESRAEAKREGRGKSDFYYVSTDKAKADMGLDPSKDYKINFGVIEAAIPDNKNIARLGCVKASSATDALKIAFESETKLPDTKREKPILDAKTRKLLGGHATFAYDRITSSSETNWAIANASSSPNKALEPGKLKPRKPVEEKASVEVKPGSLFDIYERSIATEQETLTTPVMEEAIIIAEPEQPVEAPVSEAEAVPEAKKPRKSRAPKQEAKDPTLTELYNFGVIELVTKNILTGTREEVPQPLVNKKGTPLLVDGKPVIINSFKQAADFIEAGHHKQIYGAGPATCATIEEDILSLKDYLVELGLK